VKKNPLEKSGKRRKKNMYIELLGGKGRGGNTQPNSLLDPTRLSRGVGGEEGEVGRRGWVKR